MNAAYFYTASAATGEIAVYRLSPDQGRLTPAGTVRAGGDLSSIAIDATRCRLYAADRTRPGIVTFAIDPADGTLTELAAVPTQSQVVYLSLSADRSTAYGASYADGNVCAHTIDADGIACPADQPALLIEPGARCHSVVETPGGELWVSALGHDQVHRLGHDPATGRLAERQPAVPASSASGPRHLALSVRRSEVYVIGERDARVTAYPLTSPQQQSRIWTTIPDEIRLAPGRVRSLKAENPARDPASSLPYTWAADLVLSPDERLLFSSERSSSTVSVTSALTGELLAWTRSERQPRGIAVDPSGQFLLVTGELSQTVSLYRVGDDGRNLSLVHQAPAPAGLVWAEATTLAR